MFDGPGRQLPKEVAPADDAGGRLPRKVLLRRGAFAFALALFLALSKPMVSRLGSSASLETGPVGVVAAGLLIGETATDYDLAEMGSALRVDGVIRLGAPSVLARVTSAGLHQAYLFVAIAANDSPTWGQLREMAEFMRKYATGGNNVYLNDNSGGGLAAVTAAMLLMLRGQAWPSVSTRMTPAEVHSMGSRQLRAIHELSSALDVAGRSPADGPYSAARVDPW